MTRGGPGTCKAGYHGGDDWHPTEETCGRPSKGERQLGDHMYPMCGIHLRAKHVMVWRKDAFRGFPMTDSIDRQPSTEAIWSRVDRSGGPAACWTWGGRITARGYSVVSFQDKEQKVHRFTYEALVGPIPKGLVLDHLCRNRACVNPAHMEPVTDRENILRGVSFAAINARKTHCKRGHLLQEPRYGDRDCYTCHLARQRVYAAKRAAKRAAARLAAGLPTRSRA